MPAPSRGNPLALAVLITLHERPMHPYEVSAILRERNKHESVRLNFGSLYAVVGSLERRGLIVPASPIREGRHPERTIYSLTDAGRSEADEWLTQLLSTPVNDFPAFGAGLSFLPALPPATVSALLGERAGRLQHALEAARAARGANEASGVPRVIWVEDEYRALLLEAELRYVRRLASEIETGSLEGIEWWRAIHGDAHRPDAEPRRASKAGT